jgi:hypothetical protein
MKKARINRKKGRYFHLGGCSDFSGHAEKTEKLNRNFNINY